MLSSSIRSSFDYHSYFRMGYNTFKLYSKRVKPTVFDYDTSNRKPISSFSSSSRKNMLFRLQLIDYSVIRKNNYVTLFITLTYQDKLFNAYKSMSDVKNDIAVLYKRLSRYLGKDNFFFFYKLEFTKRGIPHFHLYFVSNLLNNNMNYVNFRVWFSKNWSDIITRGLPVPQDDLRKIRLASTNVRLVKVSNQQVVFSYINKEVSKVIQTYNSFNWVGRFWGIKGRYFYKHCITDYTFHFSDSKSFFAFRRSALKYLKSKGLNIKNYNYSLNRNFMSGFTVFFVSDIRYFLELYLFYSRNQL